MRSSNLFVKSCTMGLKILVENGPKCKWSREDVVGSRGHLGPQLVVESRSRAETAAL